MSDLRGKPHGEAFPSLDVGDIVQRLMYDKFSCEWGTHGDTGFRVAVRAEFTRVTWREIDISATATRTLYGSVAQPFSGKLWLSRADSNVGGYNVWFECGKCHCRVRRIFLKHGAWACRKCHDLLYLSQRVDPLVRANAKAESLAYLEKGRPPRMHVQTYNRLMDELNAARARVAAGGKPRRPSTGLAEPMETEWTEDPVAPDWSLLEVEYQAILRQRRGAANRGSETKP